MLQKAKSVRRHLERAVGDLNGADGRPTRYQCVQLLPRHWILITDEKLVELKNFNISLRLKYVVLSRSDSQAFLTARSLSYGVLR